MLALWKRLPNLGIFLPGLLLGSSLVATRFSLGQFAPLTLVALRLLIAALAFLLAYVVFHVRFTARDGRFLPHAIVYGLVGTALTMTAFTNSLRYQSSGVTSLLASLSPITTALLASWFLHDEPLNRHRVVGALVAFTGVALLLIRGESGLHDLTRAGWQGYAWALLGMLSNSAGLVYARKYLHSADPLAVTSVRILTGAVVIAILAALFAGYDLSQARLSGVLALAYTAVAGTVIAFFLYLTSVQRHGATAASQTEYMVPLAATGLGVLLLGEHFTAVMLAGMTFIFLGLAVFYRGRQSAPVAAVELEEL